MERAECERIIEANKRRIDGALADISHEMRLQGLDSADKFALLGDELTEAALASKTVRDRLKAKLAELGFAFVVEVSNRIYRDSLVIRESERGQG